jgi:hypothetical protein
MMGMISVRSQVRRGDATELMPKGDRRPAAVLWLFPSSLHDPLLSFPLVSLVELAESFFFIFF